MSDFYREEILEHYKNPQNYGELEGVEKLEADNPLCGDMQQWYVETEGQGDKRIIKDIKFTGDGCAVSTAAASLLSEHLKGKLVLDIKYIDEEKMSEFIGTKVASGRIKCLMLPLQALKKLV